jgi:hypothetical protein
MKRNGETNTNAIAEMSLSVTEINAQGETRATAGFNQSLVAACSRALLLPTVSKR